jgi:hypothetical protein
MMMTKKMGLKKTMMKMMTMTFEVGQWCRMKVVGRPWAVCVEKK